MEEWIGCYNYFFERIRSDPRIRIGHLAVFSSLFYLCLESKGDREIKAYASEVMTVAKISGRFTYFRIIAELAEYGYIKYLPSKSKFYPSEIELLKQ